MKLLFVVPYTPTLIRTRSFNLLRALARRGNRITLLTLWTSPDEEESAGRLKSELEDVYAFPLPAWRSLANSLWALPGAQPLQAWYSWQPRLVRQMLALVQEAHQTDPFDAVHVEHLRGVKYALHLQAKSPAGPPVVWDSVDSIGLLFRQSSAQSKKRASRWLTQFELKRTERMEAHLLGQFKQILVTSQKDRAAFLAYASPGQAIANVTVLQNGVDLDYFHPDGGAARQEDALVVSGKMSYHANITMVLYLYEDIMPLIWARRPDVKLWVVGKDPSAEIQAIGSHANVQVTGAVNDLRPYLQRAAVAVAPLKYGAGIQNKVLEAMACGTPVVASRLAAASFSAEPDRDILIAQEPGEYAEGVLRLLGDPALRAAVGAAGRRYVERCHNWDKIAAQLEEVYRGIH